MGQAGLKRLVVSFFHEKESEMRAGNGQFVVVWFLLFLEASAKLDGLLGGRRLGWLGWVVRMGGGRTEKEARGTTSKGVARAHKRQL